MTLLKLQKEKAIEAPVGMSKEEVKKMAELNEKVREINEFMKKNNLGFAVQHQVIIVPKLTQPND
jgi:hypothetical protein